jgi:hypothetical protein
MRKLGTTAARISRGKMSCQGAITVIFPLLILSLHAYAYIPGHMLSGAIAYQQLTFVSPGMNPGPHGANESSVNEWSATVRAAPFLDGLQAVFSSTSTKKSLKRVELKKWNQPIRSQCSDVKKGGEKPAEYQSRRYLE